MKHLFIIATMLAFTLLLATSCTEKVNLDPHERGIVVYAMMEDSTVQQVKLFYTSYLSEDYYPPVEEAEVYMEKMEGEEAVERYDFHKKEDGLWEADLYPQQLAYYRLTVIVPGNDVITARTQFPLRNRFYPVKSKYYPPEYPESVSSNTDNNAHKAGTDIRYCQRRLFSFMDYIPESKSYELAIQTSSSILIGQGGPGEVFSVYLFDDYYCETTYSILREMHLFNPMDILNITKSDYKKPTATAFYYHNFKIEGFYGVNAFARCYYSSDGYPWHRCFHPLSYMIVRNINAEFEYYIKSVIAKHLGLYSKDVSDLTHIWEKDDIYSNVENALGIFAAECKYELMVKDYVYTDIPPEWERYNIIIPGWND